MLKYYKEYFSGYDNASLIQTLILFAFITFFVGLFFIVWKKPKGYYKNEEAAALDLDVEKNKEDKH